MIRYLRKKVVGSLLKSLNAAFYKVDSDIRNIHGWVTHLNQRGERIEGSHLSHVELTRRDIEKVNRWINFLHTHLGQLKTGMENMSNVVTNLTKTNAEILKRLGKIEEKSEKVGSVRTRYEPRSALEPAKVQKKKPRSKFKEKIAYQIMSNRKNFIIQKIMELASKNKYSTKDIEKIIVEEKQFCGRTAFYSYLKELKLKNAIDQATIGSKKVLVEASSR